MWDYLTPYSDIVALLVLDHQLARHQPDDAGGVGTSVRDLAGGWRVRAPVAGAAPRARR